MQACYVYQLHMGIHNARMEYVDILSRETTTAGLNDFVSQHWESASPITTPYASTPASNIHHKNPSA